MYVCNHDPPPLTFQRRQVWTYFILSVGFWEVCDLSAFLLFNSSKITDFSSERQFFPPQNFDFFHRRWDVQAETPVSRNSKSGTKTRAETTVSCFWGVKGVSSDGENRVHGLLRQMRHLWTPKTTDCRLSSSFGPTFAISTDWCLSLDVSSQIKKLKILRLEKMSFRGKVQ